MVEKDYCTALVEGARRIRRDIRYNEKRRSLTRKYLQVGDAVHWVTRKPFCNSRYGVVVELVPRGRYPGKWPNLRIRGFYREDVSYVICSEGRYFWPHAAWLEKCNAPVHSSREVPEDESHNNSP